MPTYGLPTLMREEPLFFRPAGLSSHWPSHLASWPRRAVRLFERPRRLRPSRGRVVGTKPPAATPGLESCRASNGGPGSVMGGSIAHRASALPFLCLGIRSDLFVVATAALDVAPTTRDAGKRGLAPRCRGPCAASLYDTCRRSNSFAKCFALPSLHPDDHFSSRQGSPFASSACFSLCSLIFVRRRMRQRRRRCTGGRGR